MKRLIVYGQADKIEGTVTFRCDGMREETYDVTDPDPYYALQGILIYQECSTWITGYVPDAELNLSGTGVTLRDIRLEYVALD